MSYKQSEVSFDLREGENWERVLKYGAIQLGVGVIVAVVCLGIVLLAALVMVKVDSTSSKWMNLMLPVCIAVVIMGQMVVLSGYEKWRGCHTKTDE